MGLSLAFLGTFTCKRDGIALTEFRAQNVRALLAYLALESDRPHEREHLCALLWPDQPLDQALTSLRQALHRLRLAIEPGVHEGSVLLTTRHSVQLNPAAIKQLDVATFAGLVSAAQHHTHRRLWSCPACIERLRGALALYRGELLTGFSISGSLPFEEWLLLRREQLHSLYITGIDALAAYSSARGDYRQAMEWLRRWLALEPWREAAHRRLIEALWYDGNGSAALRQFEQCRQALATELGIAPDATTLALQQQIRRGSQGSRAERGKSIGSLPSPTTPFVGRTSELAALADRLVHQHCRIVTLVGPGGTGKTRLALQAVYEMGYAFADGVAWVSLAQVAEDERVPTAIAAALGLWPARSQSVADQICEVLAGKELLLVLDNCEHLPGCAALVARIVERARGIVVLATSRTPLNLRAEWLMPLVGLSGPTAADAGVASYDAGQLFLQVARQVQPDFVPSLADALVIGSFCRLVDGLPLAIELAATHVRDQAATTITATLAARIHTLATTMHDIPDRHRSMRAVFEWSWNLLTRAEQALLAHLALFRSSLDLVAAQAVAAGATQINDLLESLVRSSLVRRESTGRYTLHELTRQFAAEQLAQRGETEAVAARHAAYYLGLLDVGKRAAGGLSIAYLKVEWDNLSSAWQWAVQARQADLLAQASAPLAEMLCSISLGGGVELFGQASAEMRRWADSQCGRQALVQTTFFHIYFLNATGQVAQAMEAATALARYAQANDDQLALALARLRQGEVRLYQRNFAAAWKLLAEAELLARAAVDVASDQAHAVVAISLLQRAKIIDDQQLVPNPRYAEQAWQIFYNLGYIRDQSLALYRLGNYYRRSGDYERALGYRQQALALIRSVGDRESEGNICNELGEVLMHLGSYAEAYGMMETAVQLGRALGSPILTICSLEGLARACSHLGEHEQARTYAEQALALNAAYHVSIALGYIYTTQGYALEMLGEQAAAAHAYAAAIDDWRERGASEGILEPYAGMARLALLRGDQTNALRYADKIVPQLTPQGLRDALEPLRVYWACYQALAASGDTRAATVLAQAHALIQAQARLIDDATLRRSFLEQIPENRTIIATYAMSRQAAAHSPQPIYALAFGEC